MTSQRLTLACLVAAMIVPLSLGAQQESNKQRVEGVVESLGYATAIQVGNTIYLSGQPAPGATMEAVGVLKSTVAL